MEQQTLYQRVIGEDFARLPPVLREFHSLPQSGAARGVVKVSRGRGWLRNSVAWALRLPPVGENVAVALEVQVVGEQEIWIRHFAGQRVETTQWQRGDCLIEKAGPLCFAFRVEADETQMRFHFQHNEIRGFKLPFWILRVDATAQGAGDCWQIEVTMRVPFLGLLTTYCGEIVPC